MINVRIFSFLNKNISILPIYTLNYPYFINVFIVLTLSHFLINSWDMNIKLTKKEIDFLWVWLEDDLDCQKKNGFHHNSTIIKNLKSIVNKLKKQRSKNGF